jgi:hypothetical protein
VLSTTTTHYIYDALFGGTAESTPAWSVLRFVENPQFTLALTWCV